MDQVVKDLNLPSTKLPSGTGGQLGSVDRGTGISPSPSNEPEPSPEPTPTTPPTGLPTFPLPTGTKKNP